MVRIPFRSRHTHLDELASHIRPLFSLFGFPDQYRQLNSEIS
jgi:hypothetical protein